MFLIELFVIDLLVVYRIFTVFLLSTYSRSRVMTALTTPVTWCNFSAASPGLIWKSTGSSYKTFSTLRSSGVSPIGLHLFVVCWNCPVVLQLYACWYVLERVWTRRSSRYCLGGTAFLWDGWTRWICVALQDVSLTWVDCSYINDSNSY